MKNDKLFEKKKIIKIVRDIKTKKCKTFRTIGDFSEFIGIHRKTLWKWNKKDGISLKSGPKKGNCGLQLSKDLERTIIKIHRKFNYNSYEIMFVLESHGIVNPKTGKSISRPCIDNIRKRYFKKVKLKITAKRYEKGLPGELGHIDVKKAKNIKG